MLEISSGMKTEMGGRPCLKNKTSYKTCFEQVLRLLPFNQTTLKPDQKCNVQTFKQLKLLEYLFSYCSYYNWCALQSNKEIIPISIHSLLLELCRGEDTNNTAYKTMHV